MRLWLMPVAIISLVLALVSLVLTIATRPQPEPEPVIQPLKVTILDDGGAHLTVESTVVTPEKK